MRNEELRKLDAALAEAIGIKVRWGAGIPWYMESQKATPIICYSTDGSAMLELDREMRERGYCVNVECLPPLYCAEYWKLDTDGNGMELVAAKHHKKETIARALAAYRALTGREWKGCL